MNEDIQFILDSTKELMDKAITHLKKELTNIRAGKASPAMVGSVMVDYYGSQTPLTQVANVNTPDGRTLSIQPWEKAMIKEIEKAIMNSNLGFNPMNNGESVIINVPPLTEERRKDLVKQAKAEAEESKIGVRNDRKNANNEIKKLEKEGLAEDLCRNAEIDIQELTDTYIQRIDEIYAAKEKEILTV
ncbi:MAG: ribosome recycling factor [Leeuwenhoekiella sp.]